MSKIIVNASQAVGAPFVGVKNTSMLSFKDWVYRVCFGNVPSMISQVNPKITCVFPDITSQMTGTTKYTDLFFDDLDKFIGKFVFESRELADSKDLKEIEQKAAEFYIRVKSRFHKFDIDTSKCHGSLFLGIMNLYKTVSELPLVPVSYFYLKEQSKLRFYQRLVAAHLLVPKECLQYGKMNYTGQQTTFRPYWIRHIDGLKLSYVVDYWKKMGFFDKSKSLAKTRSFTVNSTYEGTANYQMLPDPFSNCTLLPIMWNKPKELNKESINWLLNSDPKKQGFAGLIQ